MQKGIFHDLFQLKIMTLRILFHCEMATNETLNFPINSLFTFNDQLLFYTFSYLVVLSYSSLQFIIFNYFYYLSCHKTNHQFSSSLTNRIIILLLMPLKLNFHLLNWKIFIIFNDQLNKSRTHRSVLVFFFRFFLHRISPNNSIHFSLFLKTLKKKQKQ